MPEKSKTFPPLPRFAVPDLPATILGAQDYERWVMENVKRLRADGRLEAMLADENRVPVNARFRL